MDMIEIFYERRGKTSHYQHFWRNWFCDLWVVVAYVSCSIFEYVGCRCEYLLYLASIKAKQYKIRHATFGWFYFYKRLSYCLKYKKSCFTLIPILEIT